ncbi:MAG: HYR domain-containing protein [Saprospiraceae bacterium]|nr:HYR domain-containing protein [Saprospiraceae bacterium]
MRKLRLTHTLGFSLLVKSLKPILNQHFIGIFLILGATTQQVKAQCTAKDHEIAGYVYMDLDRNGVKDPGEIGIGQATVKAFGPQNQLISAILTDGNGHYVIPNIVNQNIFRLEMYAPAGFYYSAMGIQGSQDVRFVEAPACDINFGAFPVNPDCIPSIANVFTTCFVRADGDVTSPTLVGLPFQFNLNTNPYKLAMQNQTGSVWGLAWNKAQQKLYSSAFIKYGAALGIGGTGGIYVTDQQSNQTNLFIDLNAEGVNCGSVTQSNPLHCSYSDAVGKAGLGDMDMSDDDRLLFVSNLYNKSLVIIPVDHPTAANIMEVKVPDPGCSNGNYVIGAVEYYKGKVFIGVTCTAEGSKNKSDFYFHIYEFNILSKSFNIIFSTTFAKEYWLQNPGNQRPVSQWLTNLAFVNDDFMVMGITDRTGHTYCDPVYPLTGEYGDVLMLWKNGNTWQLENKGIAGTRAGNGPNHYEGPGGGEFFGDDYWIVGPGLHPEVAFGSVLVLPGVEEVVSSCYDPVYESFSGGFHKYSTLNGKKSAAIQLYNKQSSAYGKSAGLGDMAIGCPRVPIEIGNYVWIDVNENGIQDGNEKPVKGLELILLDKNCNIIAATTTDNYGYYVFNSGNVDSNMDGQPDEIKSFEDYYLVVNDSRFLVNEAHLILDLDTVKLAAHKSDFELTLVNSDAQLWNSALCGIYNNFPYIHIHTGGSGQNDYSFDIGFVLEKPELPPPPDDKIYDLALIKKVTGSKVVKNGELITFQMIVTNQGNQQIPQFELTDYIETYFQFEPALNPDWSFANGKAKLKVNTAIKPKTEFIAEITLRLNSSLKPDKIINAAEISGMWNENSVVIKDEDSTPDDINGNDKGGVPNSNTDNIIDNNNIDEDDHDSETLPVADLALRNISLNNEPVKRGEVVTFRMEIYNQGNIAASSIDIVNYISSNYVFDPVLNPGWNLNGGKAYTTLQANLQPGSSTSIDIHLKLVQQNINQLSNTAEIYAARDAGANVLVDYDSTPDNNPSNDNGGLLGTETDDLISDAGSLDEDDADPAAISIHDLALILTTDQTKPVKKNQDITFQLTVCNQGNVTVSEHNVVFYTPLGLELSPSDHNGWFIMGGLLRKNTPSFIASGECMTQEVIMRVKTDAIPSELLAKAEITGALDLFGNDISLRDWDSNPDLNPANDAGGVVSTPTDNIFNGDGVSDEDDADPAQLLLMDLALIKLYNNGTSLKYKRQANFSMIMYNQVNIPVSQIEITDYIPEGLALSNFSKQNGWSVSGANAKYLLQTPLLPNSNTSINLQLDHLSNFVANDLVNYAEISEVWGNGSENLSDYDFDSAPDEIKDNDPGGLPNSSTDNVVSANELIDEDDADPAGVPVFDLALTKKLVESKIAYLKGDTVEYIIEISNQGNVIAKDITIVDYLDAKYTFDKSLNDGWSELVDGKVKHLFELTLLPGEKASKSIFLQFAGLNKGELIPNYSEIVSAFDNVGNPGDDFDSSPDENDKNDKGGVPGTLLDNVTDDHGELDEDDHDGADSNPVNFDLAIIKDIDQVIVSRSQLLTFNIRIYNQGITAAKEIELVDYIPEGLILEDPNWATGVSLNGITKAYFQMNEQNGRLPAGGLLPGDSTIAYIKLRVDPNQAAGIIINRAEIYKATNAVNVSDEDSDPDDDPLNDPGGVVFNDSDGSSANPDPLTSPDDEDDADPAGIIIVDLERTVECFCLDNAYNGDDGQFYDELEFRSISGDTWFIYQVDGFYHELSMDPPNIPLPFITGPLGYVLDENNLGDGTSIYTIRGVHVEGIGYYIILSNQYGVKLNSGVNKCNYDELTLLKSQNNVCSGQVVRYEIKDIPNASYEWTLLSGGTIISNPADNLVDVEWTGNIGSTHTLKVDVTLANSCLSPLLIPVTIGSTAGTVSCIGAIQASLSAGCEVQITSQMLLLGGPYDYNSYAVMIFNKDGSLVPNNILNHNHLGKTLIAKVINVCNGNSCWSNILVEDKIKPNITCINDTIDCTLMKSYLKPFIVDNCDTDPQRILVDETIENTPCNDLYSKIVTRTYRAKDASGNYSVDCKMDIFLKRIQLDSLVFPDSLIVPKGNALLCGEFAADANGRPLPSVSGIPLYRGLPAWPNNDNKYCDYIVSYEDLELFTGYTCTRKFRRNWKFTLWYCNTFEVKSYVQLIEIVDHKPPELTCPYNITATTDAYTCNANVWIPMPKAIDSCSQILRIDLLYPGGLIKDFTAQYISLPKGSHKLNFYAYDLCYNVDACTFFVDVIDNTPPVALCDKETVVTLDRFGEVWVPANVFDDGSYDDCHIKSMSVRRMTIQAECGPDDLEFRDSIHFCCKDLGQEVMVMFKVTDHDGNENTCMVTVEVQDKTIPHIYCPHDVTISCHDHFDLNDLSQFGAPRVSDNCNTTYTEQVFPNIDQCREGYIDRVFTAGNGVGIDVCVQRIWIINPSPFKESDIIWPLDYETSGCLVNGLLPETLPQGYGFPDIDEDICDLVGISYQDHTFRFINGSDACYKIIRKWKVINWCRLYDPITNDPIIYTREQIIKIHNKVAPTILTGCTDTVFAIIDTSCAGGDAYLVATADDDCTLDNEIVWEYHIDLNKDGIEDYSNLGVGAVINASGFYPLGKHSIKYVFEDRCGNKSVCTVNFEILNCKPPTAYCKVGLSTSLVPMDVNGNGSVDDEFVIIWAKDFDHGSYHPCGYPLTYSFGKDTTVKSAKYDCDSIGRRTVTICVTASNGKQDCCNTYIDIQDNNNVSFCGCVKFPPNVTITDCSQNTDPVVIDSRPSIGNCTGCTHTGTSYKDSVALNVPNTCLAVYRTWKVTFDCVGEPGRTFDRTQVIIVTTDLKESDIVWPKDSVIVDNCRGSIDTADVGEVPRFCVHNSDVMLMYEDQEIRREANCVFYERIWRVFSKCVPSQTYSFRQVLKVIEGAGIRYILPPDITVTDCHVSFDPGALNGVPKTNCPCPTFQHTFVDSIVQSEPNTCYVIYRKWTSVFNCPPDVSGTFRGTQKITVRITLTVNDIQWPEDSVLVDNCRGSVDTSLINNVPRLKKDFCGEVTITFTDQTISQNDTCRIIHRTWTVLNTCSAAPQLERFTFLQVLKVTKPSGPQVKFPADITVTDCKKVLLPDSLNGFPKLNCPCNVFTHTFQDSLVTTEPNTCYVIYRKWTSIYNCPPEVSGTFRGTQKITIRINLNPLDIMWPNDTVIVDNCPGSVDTAVINNTPKLTKDYCGYVVFRYTDQILTTSGDTCRWIRRTWIASNECSDPPTKQEFSFIQILKVTNPIKPRVTIPPDITVTDCKQSLKPEMLNGVPKALCVCDSVSFWYKDDTIYTNPEVCFVIERNWEIRFICEPDYDSTFFYVQKITLDVDLNPNDITWPAPFFVSFTCNPTLDPSITGSPSLKKDYCGLVAFSFSDQPGSSGPCNGLLRTWTAINVCSPTQRFQFIQIIETKNQDPPSITCPRDTIVAADGNTCGKILVLPNPTLNNNCNTGVTFTNNAPPVFPVGMTFVVFTAQDSCGNVATCTTKVTVIENVPPEITCPGNVTISCGDDTNDLTPYGTASATDNCPGVVITETVTRNLNICDIGTITRKFVAIDASGNRDSCTQTITVQNIDPLDEVDIIWPPSPITVGECEDFDPNVTGVPGFDSSGISCLRARITSVDTNWCEIRTDCEWERTWTVYDTCSDRTFTFVQLIIIDDKNEPNILGVNDTTVYANDSMCNNFITLIAFVDNCDSANISIMNDSQFGVNNEENASGLYPVGTTVVTFTAVDGCCNVATKMVSITVIDTVAPEFTCRKVVKKIQDDGCADFNSQEFILKVDDNCTDSAFIMTSFNRDDFSDTIRTICCDSITNYEYTTAVKVYFKDQAGNIDSCCTLLQAVDEDTICGPTLLSHIKGFVRTRKDLNMQGVEVMLDNGLAGSVNSGMDGYYGFYNMPSGGSYKVGSSHDINPLNGVSTADIIHIQRHILGIATFADPLKHIAADVNSNKKVTTADIVEIRKLILGKTDRFVNSPSWKFLLTDYKFKDIEDPLNENYPTDFTIKQLNKNFYIDFTGIKMGDIDDSNIPSGLQSGLITRAANPILVHTEDQELEAGKIYEIEFRISQFEQLDGIQLGLQGDQELVDWMEWSEIQDGFVNEDNSSVNNDAKSMRLSYAKIPNQQQQGVFRLRIKLNATANLSDVLHMEWLPFNSEAYTSSNEVVPVKLEFNDIHSNLNGLNLHQNIPNPFSQSTIIPFSTDESMDIQLRILDMNGQIVYEAKRFYNAGYHEVEIHKSQLQKGGIYYYQLRNAKSQVYRRMILID